MNQSKASVSRQIHPKWRNSLPFRVGLLQTLVAAILLVATLWIMLGTLKEERLQQELNLNLSQGQLMLAKLHDLTAQLDTLVIAIADVAGTQRKSVQVIDETIPGLLSLPEHRDVIASGGIWPESAHPLGSDNQAKSFFWVRDMLGQLRKNDGYDSGRGYQEENWYKPVRLFPAGRVFWSPSYVDPYTQESMVTASVPIWEDHEFQGAATIDVSLTSLTHLVNAASHEMGGYVMLLDQFNQILSFPLPGSVGDSPQNMTSANLGTLYSRFSQFAPLAEMIDTADKAFIGSAHEHLIITQEQFSALAPSSGPEQRKMFEAIINNAARGQPKSAELIGTLEIKSDPVLNEASLISVYRMPGTFWKVVTVTPKTSFKHEAMLLAERAGLYLLLAQLIALALMFLIQQRLFIRPLARMVGALKSNDAAYLELEAGDRQDEIGVLASAFVARTRQLEIAMASLDASNLALEQQLEVQREAQQDLLAHREHLLALLKSSPNLIYIKDISGRYVLVNDKFCETIGLDRNRVVGATDHQIFSSDLVQSYTESDQRVVSQDAPLQYEEVLPTRLGELRFQMTKFAIRDEDDNLRGIGAIAFDIQSRKRLENELRTRVSQLESALEESTKERLKLDTMLRQAEFSLGQQDTEVARSDIRDHAWQTERRLVKAWYRDLVALIAHEQDALLSRACSSQASLDSLRDNLSEQAERLRLLDVLAGKHKGGQAAVPFDVLEALKTLFKAELASRHIEIHLSGERRLVTVLEGWQLALLSLGLMRLLISLGGSDAASFAGDINIDIQKDGSDCILRFERQGVGAAAIATELEELSMWLSQHFGGSLSQLPTLAVATLIDCRLPLVE
ncbi:PAS domain-containing protein [Shewanella khirikhana]|uniref:PAS domain-containing protein n=1 Tax=Shewanella khirikhana TaxID=1965282 RepID=UPI0030D16FBE